ncbi:hypothetical protein Tco_1178548 [Tanacetum coccineum]
MNAMYKSFTRKLKDVSLQPTLTNADPPVIEPRASDSDDVQLVKAKHNAFVKRDNNDPSKFQGTIGVAPLINTVKGKPAVNNDFYHEPFIFKESEKDVRDLSGKILVRKPCTGEHRWFPPIEGQIQAQFNRETLHMADRSDVMVSGVFISGLRPGHLFKDLISKPPTSLEDLFTQTHNFIRAEDANNKNHLREPHRETKQHMTYKDLLRRQMDKHVSRSVARHTESYKGPNDTFSALIKSPSEILATFEGKAMLCPPSRMFAPANKSYRTKYYEFHEDHDHDTNDCIDLRKEIKACTKAEKSRVSFPSITFSKDDPIPENCSGDDPLIIMADVGTTRIHRIYVDRRSSTKIIDHPEETSDTEEVEHIAVNDKHSKKTLAIAANLPKMLKEKLCELLRSNKDIFAWTPADMTGILWELAEHRLSIHP